MPLKYLLTDLFNVKIYLFFTISVYYIECKKFIFFIEEGVIDGFLNICQKYLKIDIIENIDRSYVKKKIL